METNYSHDPMHVRPMDSRDFRMLTPKAKQHLLNSLASLEAGRAPTPSFKLYGKVDVSLVDEFFKYVQSKSISIPEWQLAYEMSRKAKWGPQGGYAPWKDLKEGFELYYSRPRSVSQDPIVTVPNDVLKKYGELKLRIPKLNEVLDFLKDEDKIQERASGWNTFDLKKTDPVAQREALHVARSGAWKQGYGYTFSRYNKLKKRIFFPMPYSLMLLEAQYYANFLKRIQDSLRLEKHRSPFVFWADKIGFDPMFNDIVTPLCKTGNPANFVYIQRDFEKMDTTQGFDQTKTFFIPKLAAAYGIKPNSTEYAKMCDLFHFGATCPIATPDGMYTGYRGKASGANTTNGDETAGNEEYDRIFNNKLAELCSAETINYKCIVSFGNGDDGGAVYELENMKDYDKFIVFVRKAAEWAGEITGYRLQSAKWFISNLYGLYCQRMYSWKGEQMWNGYPATLILNSIVNPEKEYSPRDWDKDYRDIDIIEKLDNGRNLEYFHELVDFVDNGMKYHLLGTSEAETFRILSKYERYRALQSEAFNFQDLESRGDLSKSPTINYLLQKRGWNIPVETLTKPAKVIKAKDRRRNLYDEVKLTGR